jgi:hypothetical protein
MPRDYNKKKDNDSKKCKEEFDFDFDEFEKKSDHKRKKRALKDTLTVLNDYVESQKKGKKDKCDKTEKKDDKDDCECENDCGECVVAGREACDARVINKLLNVVYTTLPQSLGRPGNSGLIELTSNPSPITLNYFVKLPCIGCDEIKLLWPLTWMIPEIFNRVNSRFTAPAGTITLSVKLQLHVLSNELLKDPSKASPILNTGSPTNGICICNSTGAATWDYTFTFTLTSTGTGAATVTALTVTLSDPTNPSVVTFNVDLTDFSLTQPVPISAAFLTFLAETIGGSLLPIPTSVGDLPVNDPAWNISFVPSCDGDDCNRFWYVSECFTC